MNKNIPNETECEACLGAPDGQCFECFSIEQDIGEFNGYDTVIIDSAPSSHSNIYPQYRLEKSES